MSHQIKVSMGANIRRESVLINPAVSAAEPIINAENLSDITKDPEQNIIARGTSTRDVLKKTYGR